jgi:hypothetical protein
VEASANEVDLTLGCIEENTLWQIDASLLWVEKSLEKQKVGNPLNT